MPRACLLALVLLPGIVHAQDAKLSEVEKALVELVNKEREKEKLPRLTVHPLLVKAAWAHCENMARQEKFSHELDGKTVGARVTDAGYDYRSVGENIARAPVETGDDPPAPPPADIHKNWMESKGHKANVLGERYREVGVRVVKSKKGTYYYAMVFASSAK
jgi:uncharacterized protein YkwD